MVALIDDNREFKCSQACHQLFGFLDNRRIGAGKDDFDAHLAHATDDDFLGTGRVDALRHGAHHAVHQVIVDPFGAGLRRVELIDQVGAPGQVDAVAEGILPTTNVERLSADDVNFGVLRQHPLVSLALDFFAGQRNGAHRFVGLGFDLDRLPRRRIDDILDLGG